MTVAPVTLTSAFRDVMASVCTPVAVVTAMDGRRPHGTTVSAFASLSLYPPMVLVALDTTSNLLAHIRAAGRFGVNILASNQAVLARIFARKGEAKFAGVPWTVSHDIPRLTGALGWLACEVSHLVPGGDHEIVLGSVLDAQGGPGAPLTYYDRGFGTHATLIGEVAIYPSEVTRW
jgi:flavin reductase (DIM6/NTAB) family NADH-FMN oxidoreductase RutF